MIFDCRKQMRIISLDQNAVCNLAFPPDSKWVGIRDLLQDGVKSGRLLCPLPAETITESVHLGDTERRRVEEICDELSDGYCIKFFWQLVAESALALVRPGFEAMPLWKPLHRNRSTEAVNQCSRRAIDREESEIETVVNSLPVPPKLKGFTVREATFMAAKEWLGTVRSYLNRLRNGHMVGDEHFVIQQICRTFIENDVTDREITNLLEDIRNWNWLQIPALFCFFLFDGVVLYDLLQRG
jgi:hypothetical protein